MQSLITFIQTNWATEMTILFLLSEILALIPGIQSNSVFQLLFGWLKKEQQPASPPSAG